MSVEQSGASDQDGPGDEGPTIPGNGEKQFVTRTIGPSEATPSTVIGSYRLLQLIGQGGMGLGVAGRAKAARSPARRDQADQGGHGYARSGGALRE